jgi:transposase
MKRSVLACSPVSQSVQAPAPARPPGILARIDGQESLMVFQRFAKGLCDDDEAVQAGVTLPWSNGSVEGHINRLKILKRQMFGRAKIDILTQRFILAA